MAAEKHDSLYIRFKDLQIGATGPVGILAAMAVMILAGGCVLYHWGWLP